VLSHLTRARMATLVGGGGRAGRGATAGVEDSTKGAAVAVLCGREEHGGNGERRGSTLAARAEAKRE
jgi:hypothetical protein